MNELVKSFGRILVFSTIFPGLIGSIAIVALFSFGSITTDISFIWISLYIFFIGSVANALGYILDVGIEKILMGDKKGVYDQFLEKYIQKNIKSRLIADFDSLYCERVWYLNTSVILVLVIIASSFHSSQIAMQTMFWRYNESVLCASQRHDVYMFFLISFIIFIVASFGLYAITRRKINKLVSMM